MPSPDQKRTAALYHAGGDDRPPPPAPPAASDVGLTFVLAVATTLFVGVLVGASLPGMALAQLAGLGAIPLVAARARAAPLADLGLTRPSAGALAGAALLGAGIWLVNLHLVAPITEALDDGRESTRALEALVTTTPIAALLVLSLVPPLCEELACRGLLVLGLRARLGPAAAVAIGAVAFAALHLSLVRAAPMLVLGAALGALTVWSRSVVPAIAAHAINNAISLTLAAGYAPAITRGIDTHRAVGFAAALALCLCGLTVAWRSRATNTNLS